MCWADKIVIALAAMFLLFLFTAGYNPNYSYSPNNDPWNALSFALHLFVPLWLLLRLFDLLAGGPCAVVQGGAEGAR